AFDYLRRRLDLMVELTSFLKREVDIVVLNEAPPLLGHRVIAGGTLILCRDEVFRVRLETRVVAEYVDNLPLHEEYNRVLTERIKGGRFLG
ncbi:MAG: nucleotidyltransferase domain-containing protein, partial [Acidobacteriota bacterium]